MCFFFVDDLQRIKKETFSDNFSNDTSQQKNSQEQNSVTPVNFSF